MLVDGGLWFALTPNGNWEKLLDLAERWSLKIPEGPHQFLTTRQLRAMVGRHFEVLEHRTILALPAGPTALSTLIDRLSLCAAWGGGFFQYIVARKKPSDGTTYDPTPRVGDHICCITNLAKLHHYPGWELTRGLDDIVEDVYAAARTALQATLAV